MDEDFDDIWDLVRYCSKTVAPPWPALREVYCRGKVANVIGLHDSTKTAEELGLVKEVEPHRYRITVKGYKLAEKLWGPREVACREKRKRSLWDLID